MTVRMPSKENDRRTDFKHVA